METRKPDTSKRVLHGQEGTVSHAVVTSSAAQGAMDYTPFIWQQLGDIQKSLGALHTAVDGLRESSVSTKSKIQELSDLRNKFIGGTVVFGILATGASGLVIGAANKVWNTIGELAKPTLAQALQHRPEIVTPALKLLPVPPAQEP